MKIISTITFLVTFALSPIHISANHNTDEALGMRVAKIGKLNIGDGSASSQSSSSASVDINGQAIYNSACAACHNAGIAGAPKFGDTAAWAERSKQGINNLIASVINGKGAMPSRAGRSDLTDEQIAASLQYILDNS